MDIDTALGMTKAINSKSDQTFLIRCDFSHRLPAFVFLPCFLQVPTSFASYNQAFYGLS